MKFNKHTYTLILLALAGSLLLNCGDDEPAGPTDQDLAFEKLAGAWTFGTSGSITLDGQDVSLNYPGFSLSFTDGTYQTQNAGDLLSASGTWQWVDESAEVIVLDSGEQVTIVNLTDTNFQFSFTSDGTGGEVAGTAGNYVVTVEK